MTPHPPPVNPTASSRIPKINHVQNSEGRAKTGNPEIYDLMGHRCFCDFDFSHPNARYIYRNFNTEPKSNHR